jgi:hydrogenase nickel incorporation protein HypB
MSEKYRVITVRRDVQSEVKRQAAEFREFMTRRHTLVVNLISSPGAGKTSLLSTTLQHWKQRFRMAVLVGDIATERDAERLAEHAPAVQLTTGGACHLEHALVWKGWQALGEPELDFLFIENVGNLVCPSSHDLGEHGRVVLLSVTEGDDKPAKYPKAFYTSQAVLISKCDIMPYVPFEMERAIHDVHSIRPSMPIFPVSVHPVAGLEAWCDWLLQQRAQLIHSCTTANAC